MTKPNTGLRRSTPRTAINAVRRDIYLRELAQIPVKARAARIASEGLPAITPRTGFDSLEKRDPEFAAQVAEAIRTGFERIEEKAMKLALDGGRRPIVTGKGEVIAYETIEYPQIILKLLSSGLRDKYGEKQDVHVTGTVETNFIGRPGAVEITPADLAVLPPDRRKEFIASLRQIADARAERQPGEVIPINRGLPAPGGTTEIGGAAR
ncbi:MAG: hypothetical protein U1E42_08375 [Rhodospirillales bacterium]